MAGWEVTSSRILKPRQNFQQDLKNGTWNNQLSHACMSNKCRNSIFQVQIELRRHFRTCNAPLVTVAHSPYNKYLCSHYIAHIICIAMQLDLIPTLTNLAHHRLRQYHQVHQSLVWGSSGPTCASDSDFQIPTGGGGGNSN